MELTSEQFQQLSGCDAVPAAPDRQDRRAGVRVIFGKRAKIRPLFGSAPDGGRTALLRDVSVSGVGFLVADAMEAGDEFILRTPAETGDYLYLHCIVRRCEPGGTGGKQFIVGASFELLLDPATLSEEQTADHYERTEINAALRAVDDANDPEEAAPSGSLVRGFCTRIKSVLEARQAAKLRKRLRPEGSAEDDDDAADESSATSPEKQSAENATLDSVLSSISPATSSSASSAGPTTANEKRRSLFASTPVVASQTDADVTAEKKVASPAPVVAPASAKDLSDTELAAIIASNYGVSAPQPQPAAENETTEPASAAPADVPVSEIPAVSESAAPVAVADAAPVEEPVAAEVVAPVEEAVAPLPVAAEPVVEPAAIAVSPVAPVVIPAPRVAAMSNDVYIPPAYASRKPSGVSGAAGNLIIPSAPSRKAPQPTPAPTPIIAPALVSAPTPAPAPAPVVAQEPAPAAVTPIIAPTLVAEPTPVSSAAPLTESEAASEPAAVNAADPAPTVSAELAELPPVNHQTKTEIPETPKPRVAPVAATNPPAKPATRVNSTPEIAMSNPNSPQPAPTSTKPQGPINSCEMVFQMPMAYSSETFEGFALPAQLENSTTENAEVATPKSAYFPPELNGPHAAVRAASPETLLRNAAARSRHSRRSGRSTLRR